MKPFPDRKDRRRSGAYTLIEALVASSILLIGIAAAGSMSLTLVTQEEINERSVAAVNYLDNAARLFQFGMDPGEIEAVLPEAPVVDSLTFSTRTVSVPGLGDLPATTLSLTYHPSPAKSASAVGTWTGGDQDATRTISVEVIRADSDFSAPFPRAQHFGP